MAANLWLRGGATVHNFAAGWVLDSRLVWTSQTLLAPGLGVHILRLEAQACFNPRTVAWPLNGPTPNKGLSSPLVPSQSIPGVTIRLLFNRRIHCSFSRGHNESSGLPRLCLARSLALRFVLRAIWPPTLANTDANRSIPSPIPLSPIAIDDLYFHPLVSRRSWSPTLKNRLYTEYFRPFETWKVNASGGWLSSCAV